MSLISTRNPHVFLLPHPLLMFRAGLDDKGSQQSLIGLRVSDSGQYLPNRCRIIFLTGSFDSHVALFTNGLMTQP